MTRFEGCCVTGRHTAGRTRVQRSDRILAMMSKPLLISALILAHATSAFPQTASVNHSLVNNVGNFIHGVADLDRSVHFYHDVLGMDLPRPVGDWQTTE